jgi:hypothetical protein
MATEPTAGAASAQFQHFDDSNSVCVVINVACGLIEVLSWKCYQARHLRFLLHPDNHRYDTV